VLVAIEARGAAAELLNGDELELASTAADEDFTSVTGPFTDERLAQGRPRGHDLNRPVLEATPTPVRGSEKSNSSVVLLCGDQGSQAHGLIRRESFDLHALNRCEAVAKLFRPPGLSAREIRLLESARILVVLGFGLFVGRSCHRRPMCAL